MAAKVERVRLTATEADILLHRLESGCIGEVLADTYGFDEATVEDTAFSLANAVRAGTVGAELLALPHAADVLVDAVDGSTYGAAAESALQDGELSRQKYAGVVRAGDSLAAKVAKLTGRDVAFPHE